MASFGGSVPSPVEIVQEAAPTEAAPPDFSTVDWPLFIALCGCILFLAVLLLTVGCAVFGKTKKPKPRLVKKDH